MADEIRQIIERLRELLASGSREQRLMVAASRVEAEATTLDEIAALAGEIDWDSFAAKVEAHRVAPLTYSTLSSSNDSGLIPESAMSKLNASYVKSSLESLLWQRTLARTVRALNEAGIHPVLLKGAALLLTVYDDPAVRQLRDLDLLVASEGRDAAESALLGIGCRPAGEKEPPGVWPPDWYEKKYLCAVAGGAELTVELHWELARRQAPFSLSVEEAIAAAVPVGSDAAALVLGRAHQLLHLCIHMAYNDGFGVGLSRLVDLNEYINRCRGGLDWYELGSLARSYRASLCLLYCLVLVSALFGTEIPWEALLHPRSPRPRPSIAEAALQRVLANDTIPTPLPSTMVKIATTDRPDLRSAMDMLLPKPREIRHYYRLASPARLFRAVHYVWRLRDS